MGKSEKILQLCRENDIRMIDFKMVDLDGRFRHITIPVERFGERIFEYGIGFDGSNYGYAPIEKSDMVFIPDPDSAVMDPFVEIPTLSMTGDVCVIGEKENRPFDQYPRNVALRAVDYMKATGTADQMLIGPEFEFYLFDTVNYQVSPNGSFYEVDTRQAEWNTGTAEGSLGYQVKHKGGYHIAAPQDISYNLRSKMCMLMEDWGIRVKYHHHEVGGPGQLEIEVELGEMVDMADKTMITKYIVKNAAAQEGRTATFMPKPVYQEAGSGMHVHMLLFKEGRPVFYDKDGYSSLSHRPLFYRRPAEACAFSLRVDQSFHEFLQTSGSGIRSSGDHRLCHVQPECGHPYTGICKSARGQEVRTAEPGCHSQSLLCLCRHIDGRAGRH